jgi:hypothetical protein
VILPQQTIFNLNEFISNFNAVKVPEGFCYNSGTNQEWETVSSLKALIKDHVDSSI